MQKHKISNVIIASILILVMAYVVFPKPKEPKWVQSSPTATAEGTQRKDKDDLSGDFTGAQRYRVTANFMDLEAVDSYPQSIDAFNENGKHYEIILLKIHELIATSPVPYVQYEYDAEIAQYLEATNYIQTDTPLVTKTAQSFLTDSTTVQEIVRNALEWNKESSGNITYDTTLRDAIWLENNLGHSAEETLEYGTGTCVEYANTFIAFMRNLGIPARYVMGYWENGGSENTGIYHAWAEYYLKGYGWIPVETQNGTIGMPSACVKLFVGKDYEDIGVFVSQINADYEKLQN